MYLCRAKHSWTRFLEVPVFFAEWTRVSLKRDFTFCWNQQNRCNTWASRKQPILKGNENFSVITRSSVTWKKWPKSKICFWLVPNSWRTQLTPFVHVANVMHISMDIYFFNPVQFLRVCVWITAIYNRKLSKRGSNSGAPEFPRGKCPI